VRVCVYVSKVCVYVCVCVDAYYHSEEAGIIRRLEFMYGWICVGLGLGLGVGLQAFV